MQFGNVTIAGRTVLAPMSGYTDRAYRRLCHQAGAALVCTEMVNAEGVVRQNTTTLRQLFFNDTERPIAVQLFGCDASVMAAAAEQVTALSPEMIDLNFGCPADKVVQRGMGAALLRDLPLMASIIHAVVRATHLPVTVKLRSGWSPNTIVAEEAARIAESSGATAVTLHPRTRSAQFEGAADWTLIRQVKAAVRIPVIGNGDIQSARDAVRMLTTTHCDGVMIGRAALGNPWIFRQVEQLLTTGEPAPAPTIGDRINMLHAHVTLATREQGDIFGLEAARRHLPYYCSDIPEWKAFRDRLLTAPDVPAFTQALTDLQAAAVPDTPAPGIPYRGTGAGHGHDRKPSTLLKEWCHTRESRTIEKTAAQL